MTGYLRTVNARLRPYRSAAEPLAELVRSSGSHKILDLCSGSGGPWPELGDDLRALDLDVEVRCSDLWPTEATADWIERAPGFTMCRESVCAMEVPPDLEGTRTLFTALHHFEPAEVRAMLEDAQASRRHFAAFEITHRSWRGLLVTCMTPIMALFLMPTVRPLRVLPLMLSYLPPLVPLAIGWDGTVSTLRSYRKEELEALVAPMRGDGYQWTVEERNSGTPLPMTCIMGRPSEAG